MKQHKLEKSPTLKLLVYGDSGSGKTHLIGTFQECPETSPVLVLNARGQPVTLRHFDPPPLVLDLESMKDFNVPYQWIKAGQPWEPVEKAATTDKVASWGGVDPTPFLKAIWNYFDSVCGNPGTEELMETGRSGTFKFKTAAVDSITQVQRIALDAIVGNVDALPGDDLKPTQIQHWGAALGQLTKLADLYYQLPINVILTALTRRDTIQAMGLTLFCPFIWGQSSLEVPSHAEIVGRLINIESMRQKQATAVRSEHPQEFANAFNVLLTRGGRTYMAKWQGVLNPPDLVISPTAQKLIGIVNA